MRRQLTYIDLLNWFIISGLFIFIAVLFALYVAETNDKISQQAATIRQLDSLYNDARDSVYEKTKLNWVNISYWCNYFEIEQPEIVMKQIALETGNLTSEMCRCNNNIFGMRFPKARETAVAYITMNGYAGYSTYIESIRCYALWQKKYYNGGDYYQFLLRSGYAKDTAYIQIIKNVKL